MYQSQSVSPVCELPVDFTFTDAESTSLKEAIMKIESNPYDQYYDFMDGIKALIKGGFIPERFQEFSEKHQLTEGGVRPFRFFRNCPIDSDVPTFDFADPVNSKKLLKKTFVAEGFLAIFSYLFRNPPIGYINVNGGDVFQDIYPRESMAYTQSQKALGELYFHKDLANHFVRPDFVNMLAMRSSPKNQVYTTFVRNTEIIEQLSDEILNTLREQAYYTPYDDLTVSENQRELGEATMHPVLVGDCDFRYFENRTIAYSEDTRAALEVLRDVLHERKARVLMLPGDFISVDNNTSLHAKDVIHVEDEEILKTRWTIKTVNVRDLSMYADKYVPDRWGIVEG